MKISDLRLRSSSSAEPQRLLHFLAGAIHGCGGWIHRRACSGAGVVQVSFEFERGLCVEMYAVLIASELTLSPHSNQALTEFCQCTYGLSKAWRSELVGIYLEVETHPPSMTLGLDPALLSVA